MPTFQDPKVAAATVRLKNQQSRLTALRRQVLSGDYIARADHEAAMDYFVAFIREKFEELPGVCRRAIPEDLYKEPGYRSKLEDAVQAAVDDWRRKVAAEPLPALPSRAQTKSGHVYTSRPGPRPGSKRKPSTPHKLPEAAE